MKLLFTAPALADVESIIAYISEMSPAAAKRVYARIMAVADRASQHPRLGKRTSNPKLRRMTVTPYPYLLFYEPARDGVIVHAVRHGARDPSSMPGGT